MPNNAPHNALRYHVPGAVARGESEAIYAVAPVSLDKASQYRSLGKFYSARDSALYDYSLDCHYNGSGDSEAPTGWFTPVSIDADILADWVSSKEVQELNDMVEAREKFDTLIGHFLVSGDDRGFVYVQEFDTEEELERAYDALNERYNVWSAPYAIVDISEYVQDRYETREEAEQALASFGAGYTIIGEA